MVWALLEFPWEMTCKSYPLVWTIWGSDSMFPTCLVSRYLSCQVSNFPGSWVSDFLGCWVSDFSYFWVSNFPGFWLFRFLTFCTQGGGGSVWVTQKNRKVSGFPQTQKGFQVPPPSCVQKLESQKFPGLGVFPKFQIFWLSLPHVQKVGGIMKSSLRCCWNQTGDVRRKRLLFFLKFYEERSLIWTDCKGKNRYFAWDQGWKWCFLMRNWVWSICNNSAINS